MGEAIKYLVGWIVGTIGVVGVILLVAYLTPDKAAQWAQNLAKMLSFIPRIYRAFSRAASRLHLSRALNSTLRSAHGKELVVDERRKVKVQWVTKKSARELAVTSGKPILRVRPVDTRESNIVEGVLFYVSQFILGRTKIYLNATQARSLDLFVTSNLLASRRSDVVVDQFLREYLVDEIEDDPDIGDYFSAFESIKRRGLFWDFLLPEADFLGRKVFGRWVKDAIADEFENVVGLGVRVATRQTGELTDLMHLGEYARCGIVIVGSREKITTGPGPWVNHIRSDLSRRSVESIYLIGDKRNAGLIRSIARAVESDFEDLFNRASPFLFPDGGRMEGYVTALRSRRTTIFAPRADELSRTRFANGPAIAVGELREDVVGTIDNVGPEFGFMAPDDPQLAPDNAYFKTDWAETALSKGDRVECTLERFSDGRVVARDVRAIGPTSPSGP